MCSSVSHDRQDDLFQLGDLNALKDDLYDLAHVTGWERYDPHDLASSSAVGSVLCTDVLTIIPRSGQKIKKATIKGWGWLRGGGICRG